MSEDLPTTEDVRAWIPAWGIEEFDLWLAAHDREVAAKAYDEGRHDVLHGGGLTTTPTESKPPMSDLTNLITDLTAVIADTETRMTDSVRSPATARMYQRMLGHLRSGLHSLELAAEAEAELPHALAEFTDEYGDKR